MCRKKGLQVSSAQSVIDVSEELELSLHATRAEDGERFAGVLPRFDGRDDIVEERSLELAFAIAGLPQIACGAVSQMVLAGR